MSPNYEKQVLDLRDWFKERITTLPDVVLTQLEYRAGTDMLKEPFAPLTTQAFDEWLAKRNYELSYSQICSAFFNATAELGKLKVTDEHQTAGELKQ